MITAKMIENFADNHSIGETFDRESKTLATERNKATEKVRIIAKYKHYCIVTNGRYNYCLEWVDLIRKEMGYLLDTEDKPQRDGYRLN